MAEGLLYMAVGRVRKGATVKICRCETDDQQAAKMAELIGLGHYLGIDPNLTQVGNLIGFSGTCGELDLLYCDREDLTDRRIAGPFRNPSERQAAMSACLLDAEFVAFCDLD